MKNKHLVTHLFNTPSDTSASLGCKYLLYTFLTTTSAMTETVISYTVTRADIMYGEAK